MDSLVILYFLSIVATSECQSLLLPSSEMCLANLRKVERETEVLRTLNVRLNEEITARDNLLKSLGETVSSLQYRVSTLELEQTGTLPNATNAELWIEGQKAGYQRLVRLVDGGSSYGRLEVNIDGHGWGNVCDDGCGHSEAMVVCRQLGYSTGVATTGAYHGEGTLDIVMDEVDCSGLENAIQNCRYVGMYNHDCYHFEDVGIICS